VSESRRAHLPSSERETQCTRPPSRIPQLQATKHAVRDPRSSPRTHAKTTATASGCAPHLCNQQELNESARNLRGALVVYTHVHSRDHTGHSRLVTRRQMSREGRRAAHSELMQETPLIARHKRRTTYSTFSGVHERTHAHACMHVRRGGACARRSVVSVAAQTLPVWASKTPKPKHSDEASFQNSPGLVLKLAQNSPFLAYSRLFSQRALFSLFVGASGRRSS